MIRPTCARATLAVWLTTLVAMPAVVALVVKFIARAGRCYPGGGRAIV